jgi:hypothetical protein
VDPIAHGYDWAWAQIGGQSVRSNGGSFVWRYLGGTARLTPTERDNLHRDGVNIGLVWETAADATEGGYARGQSDARAANAEADGLGYPHDCLLVYADDQNDPDPTQEVAYKRGVNSVDGRPSDLYSGGNVLVALDRAGLRTFGGWMVETWFPHVGADPFMVQLANTRDPAMAGVDPGQYDTNLLDRPVPLWGPNGTTSFGDDMTDAQLEALKKEIAQWHQDDRAVILRALIGDDIDLLHHENILGGWMQQQTAAVVAEVHKVLDERLGPNGT